MNGDRRSNSREPGERRLRGPRVRRAVVFLPNGFTLANLLFGIYAIVLASRGKFSTAAFCVMLGGLADVLDGRVARATGTGSRFGEELDSLVDAISFGLAPAIIMFFAVLDTDNWDWLLVFFFTSCAVMRLARFNVEQAGRAKTHFHGLPSPAAGMTLASYWWFSNTTLYKQTVILFTDTTIADLPWHTIIPAIMLLLGGLMLSDVPYPAVPTVGLRTMRQRIGSIVLLASIAGLFLAPKQFIFPAMLVYIVVPLVQSVALGFLQRRGAEEGIFQEEEEPDGRELDDDPRASDQAPGRPQLTAAPAQPDIDEQRSARRKRRRRRPHGSGNRPTPHDPNSPPPGNPAA